jgi:hypothetical protein
MVVARVCYNTATSDAKPLNIEAPHLETRFQARMSKSSV